jgi:hypothetical protein
VAISSGLPDLKTPGGMASLRSLSVTDFDHRCSDLSAMGFLSWDALNRAMQAERGKPHVSAKRCI